jgi:hypothetical protein
MNLYEPPVNQVIAGLLLLTATRAAVASTRLVAEGLRLARPLELVRGIRAAILALVAGLFAVGFLCGQSGFLVAGAIILGEELYETTALGAVIRLGERGAPSAT